MKQKCYKTTAKGSTIYKFNEYMKKLRKNYRENFI